eukprot:scaffold803_cov310-Pinguiococcus_pyrenoidosus.AAC.162
MLGLERANFYSGGFWKAAPFCFSAAFLRSCRYGQPLRSRQPIRDSSVLRSPISDFRFPISDFRFPIPNPKVSSICPCFAGKAPSRQCPLTYTKAQLCSIVLRLLVIYSSSAQRLRFSIFVPFIRVCASNLPSSFLRGSEGERDEGEREGRGGERGKKGSGKEKFSKHVSIVRTSSPSRQRFDSAPLTFSKRSSRCWSGLGSPPEDPRPWNSASSCCHSPRRRTTSSCRRIEHPVQAADSCTHPKTAQKKTA